MAWIDTSGYCSNMLLCVPFMVEWKDISDD